MAWRRLNGINITEPILATVEQTIIEEIGAGSKLKICIGTDSTVCKQEVEFATVIVFLREKRGGFVFVENSKLFQKVSIKERMILEVSRSVEVAYHLCDLLDKYSISLEVHADINSDPSFKSNVALKEAMGYIRGMGFKFKAKPDAFASTNVADKFV
jgi:predicted RNase H-related nuclease YkuK (DUF458 family)